MYMSTEINVNKFVFRRGRDLPWLRCLGRAGALLLCIAFMIAAAVAQAPYQSTPADNPYVVEGASDTIVYSVGRSLRINGTAKNGAFALGGDVDTTYLATAATLSMLDTPFLKTPSVSV